MWPDVTELRDFYKTRLGHVARRMIQRKLRTVWPQVSGQRVMALGYPTPYLRYYRENAKHMAALMPAEQGALSWSKTIPNIVALTEETLLPLADKSVDLAFIIHALEFTSYPHEMIREIWRVLADGGRLILVVPNRTGLWSRIDKTPFGQGQTYSLSQLLSFLKDNSFMPTRVEHVLYVPPSQSRLVLSTARAWENIGYRWFQSLSGVIFVEVTKRIYAQETLENLCWRQKFQLAKKFASPAKPLSHER